MRVLSSLLNKLTFLHYRIEIEVDAKTYILGLVQLCMYIDRYYLHTDFLVTNLGTNFYVAASLQTVAWSAYVNMIRKDYGKMSV